MTARSLALENGMTTAGLPVRIVTDSTCNLRLDDTDPSGESMEYVESIIRAAFAASPVEEARHTLAADEIASRFLQPEDAGNVIRSIRDNVDRAFETYREGDSGHNGE